MTIALGFACLSAAASARRLAIACRRSAIENPRYANFDLAEAERHKRRAFEHVARAGWQRDPPFPDRRTS